MTSTNLIEAWTREYLRHLSNHGVEQIAARLAGVGLDRLSTTRRINRDFREAEKKAKLEYKRIRKVSWNG